MSSLGQRAATVLLTADPHAKAVAAKSMAAEWRQGVLTDDAVVPPSRPARPERPELLPPKAMPKRTYSGLAGRVALVHALAHIELNAIDLACDILYRYYASDSPPRDFLDDWVKVADDEALHFELLSELLVELGATYGELPAHDGLWQAADKTAHDLLARLAIVPLALEARGLDTTPSTVEKLRRGGDARTAEVLDIIYRDEITHVAAGVRWFRHFTEQRGLESAPHYRLMLARYFPGGLMPPFNHAARAEAGMPQEWYEPIQP